MLKPSGHTSQVGAGGSACHTQAELAEWIIGKIAVIANKRHFGISGSDSGPGRESLATRTGITPAPFELINKQKCLECMQT